MWGDRPNLHRGGVLVLWLALCGLALVLLGPISESSATSWPGYRKCGSFPARYRVHVFARHVSCRKATQVEKEYWLAPESEKELVGPDPYNGYVRLKRFPGWRCTSGAMAGGCRKGRKEAAYSTYNPRASRSAGPLAAWVRQASARHGSSRPCRSIAIDYTPVPGEHYNRMYVMAPASIRCSRARSHMRRYRDDHRPCEGSSCYRSYPGGWDCNSVTPGQWPLIQECRRGGTRVLGFVKSKIKGSRRAQLAAFSPPAARGGRVLRLSPQGLGPIHFGMNAATAERALGSAISVEEGINGCAFWSVTGMDAGSQLLALHGSLAYALLFQRGTSTTREIEVGDSLSRLRHRYRSKLHGGRSASLSGAEKRLFVTKHEGDATYEIEFDIANDRVAFISAGTQHVIETFGECA